MSRQSGSETGASAESLDNGSVADTEPGITTDSDLILTGHASSKIEVRKVDTPNIIKAGLETARREYQLRQLTGQQ